MYRGHKKGECAASECTLLCNDFLRLGYAHFIVDPNVRHAYTRLDALDVHKPEFVRGIRYTDWADVQSSPRIDWSLTPHRPYYKYASYWIFFCALMVYDLLSSAAYIRLDLKGLRASTERMSTHPLASTGRSRDTKTLKLSAGISEAWC
jgi:hypothetical protein